MPDTPQGRNQPQLVGGVNFTTWPYLKWRRALRHLRMVEEDYLEWLASEPVAIESALRSDRLAFDLTARVRSGYPTWDWSLTLGDAVHNIRSALDAVAWGMAHFDGATPTRPRAVQFPICRRAADWAKVEWVNEIRPEFRDRIECIQPYHYAPSGNPSALSLLHDLDIQDKHRESLSLELEFIGIDLRLQYELEDATMVADPHVEMDETADLRDGARVGTIHTGGQVKGETGRIYLRPFFKVWVGHAAGKLPLSEVIQTLVRDCETVLGILHQGRVETDPLDNAAPAEDEAHGGADRQAPEQHEQLDQGGDNGEHEDRRTRRR